MNFKYVMLILLFLITFLNCLENEFIYDGKNENGAIKHLKNNSNTKITSQPIKKNNASPSNDKNIKSSTSPSSNNNNSIGSKTSQSTNKLTTKPINSISTIGNKNTTSIPKPISAVTQNTTSKKPISNNQIVYNETIIIENNNLTKLTIKPIITNPSINSCYKILNKPINYNNKEIMGYGINNDFNYYKNYFFWSKIDTLVLNSYIKNLKDIICLAHQNNVRSIVNLNQNDFSNYFKSLNFKPLIDLLELNGFDGILINIKTNINSSFINEIKKIYKLLKEKNSNFIISVSIPLTNNSFNDNEIKDLFENSDYLLLQSFNSINSTGIKEYNINQIVPANFIRDYIFKNYFSKFNNFKNKIIISLSIIGVQKTCNSKNGSLNIFNLDVSNCEQENLLNINYNEIYNYILNNGDGYISSGELWNLNSRTPYLNYFDFNQNKIYQIQYENSKSFYYKILNTGIGGISLWGIDTLNGLPNIYINNLFVSINKNLFGSSYKKDLNIY